MDCSLFDEIFKDAKGGSSTTNEEEDDNTLSENMNDDLPSTNNEDDDSWVQVLVPVMSLHKHIKNNDPNITEAEVLNEINREKVLEMLRCTKIETIPISTQAQEPAPVSEPPPPPPEETGIVDHFNYGMEPSSGRLFVPASRKRLTKEVHMFQCNACLKGFTRIDNLKRHVKILHEGSQLFTCKECGKSFKRKNTLNRHVVSQHTREKRYACKLCDKKFIYSFEVNTHIQNDHSGGYQCSQCNKKFRALKTLESHVSAVHNGIQYKCTECNAKCQTLEAFKKHGAKFHPVMDTASSSKKHEELDPNVPVIYCPHCPAELRGEDEFMKHYVKIHSQTKGEIACELCLNLFANEDAFKRHVAKFHDIKVSSTPTTRSDTTQESSKETENQANNPSGDSIFEISLTEFLSKSDDKQGESLVFLENSDEDIDMR